MATGSILTRALRKAVDAAIPRFHLEALDRRVLLTGDIFVTILHDANGNGVKDPEEPALEGWSVFVDLDRDEIHDPGEPIEITDIDGEAFITGLAEDTYDLVQVLQPGWMPAPGYDVLDRVHVQDGEVAEVLFLNVPASNGSIEGDVWNDINGDGVRDAEDTGLAGWTVFLDSNTNGTLDAGETSVLTDANGLYVFPNLPAGQYRVREILPFNWDTTLGYDQGVTVDVNPATATIQDFGNFFSGSLGSITGAVWNDVNADGIRAAGDSGLGGWTVFLDTNANSILDATEQSATTDALGVYSFPSVVAGAYRVVEVLQAGWNTSPGFPAVRNITVIAENTTNVQYGVWTPTLGSISGNVWNDQDGNGIDNAEAGLAGWTVYIDQDSDGILDATELSANTDAAGNYTISSVPVGSNVVRTVSMIGWMPTAPGTGMQLVTVPNGSNVPNINFGQQQRTDSSIRGKVFVDANDNETLDLNERGLPGITIYIDSNNNGALDAGEPSKVTSVDLFYTPAVNEAGSYEFTHLVTGTYVVREIVPAELSATHSSQRVHTINLAAGEDRNHVHFANRFRGNEIHGHKYNDLNGSHSCDPGEPGIGGVTIYLDIDRDNVMDAAEPRTLTAADGSYAFTTNLSPTAYVVREIMPWGYRQTFPATTGGTLWPAGVSNPAIGNVTPTSITTVLSDGQTHSQTVSLTLPGTGALTDMVDVFLLFDDTGSFTANSPIVRSAFPQIISALQTALPGINLGFGVGRFEEYANFAAEYSTGRPFVLNQPIISASTPGFSTSIQSALDRTAPGYGGDTPETVFEALFQTATGRGFDGNNNGTLLDSGAAGLVSTQLNPGASGDVPSYVSFTPDASGNVLPASGSLGGAGFRAGALPIILTATDTGFAYQPRGETSITGLNGLTLPVSALTQASRNTTPFASGAGIQETITALNALGALVIGLGTNPQATLDPRQGLEAIAKLTGAINQSLATIANGTTDPIAPGDPFYFQIASGFAASVANGIVAAIQNAVTNVAVNLTLKASDPRVQLTMTPGVLNNIGAGETATFDIQFTGDGRPHRFDLQFVREGTDVVLGSIPVVIGTPIAGDGYSFEDLDEGEIDDTVDFGNQIDPLTPANQAPSFVKGADQTVLQDSGLQTVGGWASSIAAGPVSESAQSVDFIVSNDNNALFSVQPAIAPDGTLAFTPAAGAFGTATVTVQLHDNAGTANGGVDSSAVQTFIITVQQSTTTLGIVASAGHQSGNVLTLDFSQDVQGSFSGAILSVQDIDTAAAVTLQTPVYDAPNKRATIYFNPASLPDGRYRLSIAPGALPNLPGGFSYDFIALKGDADGDGRVNTTDFNRLAGNFGGSSKTFADGDFDYSTTVDSTDFAIFAGQYGKSYSLSAAAATPAAALFASAAMSPSLLDEVLV